MGWDRHKLLWDGMGQKNMSHGQACLSPSLFFSKPRFINNSNETPNFTVIFIICAKFRAKAGAQNSFLPPDAGYPSYATGCDICF